MFEIFAFSLITALIITGFFLLFVKISGIEKLLLKKEKTNENKGQENNEE